MAIQIPNSGRDVEEPIPSNHFRGILKSITLENTPQGFKVGKQLKLVIEPTSYNGKVRYEWFNFPSDGKQISPNSKFGRLQQRLTTMNLYTPNNGILDDKMINKEFDWEVVEYDVNWPATKCSNCNLEFKQIRETREHRQKTQHKIKDPCFLLPFKIVGENGHFETEYKPNIAGLNITDTILKIVSEKSMPQRDTIDYIASLGFNRADVLKEYIVLTTTKRVYEKDGRLFVR